jgi:hypothetical protein
MEDIASKFLDSILTHEHMLTTMPFDMAWTADPDDPEKVDPITVILATAVWSTRYLGFVPPNFDKTIIQ